MRRRLLQIALALLLGLVGVLGIGTAQPHELNMAEMEIREVAPGQFTWQWTASGGRPAASELSPLSPLWPAGCVGEP